MKSFLRGAALLAAVGLVACCNGPVSGTPAVPTAREVLSTAGQPTSTSPVAQRLPSTAASGSPGGQGALTTVAPTLPGAIRSTPSRPAVTTLPGAVRGGAVHGGAVRGSVGAAGIGDPYYPLSGNGGYEVDHYDIALSYDPASDQLSATTTITATVTSTSVLGRFDLDLQPTMSVSSVQVDGAHAASTHPGAELVVTPAAGLSPGASVQIVVAYAGHPTQIPGGTAGSGAGGWYRTPSGGAIAIGEPFSASAWYPVNEHPSDPASYRVTATVPQKWSVASNGVAVTTGLPAAPTGQRVFRWVQAHPVTSYESTIYIDTFTTVLSRTVDGKPIVSVFAPSPDVARYQRLAGDTARILQVLSNHFGPYPFAAAGGIYTGQNLAFALETATRPVYADWVSTDTIVHELTHQWFGDDVVLQRWSDICLNECFASYGPWLWAQDQFHTDLDAQWVSLMAVAVTRPSFWSSPLVDMGPGKEFTAVYSRGPLALHALRKEMGEASFARLLRDWPATYGGKAASWSDLVDEVDRLAGRDLRPFLNAWFRGTTVPAAQYLHPGGIGQ